MKVNEALAMLLYVTSADAKRPAAARVRDTIPGGHGWHPTKVCMRPFDFYISTFVFCTPCGSLSPFPFDLSHGL
jgi:hypothetical protein